ncbi:NAD-dependent epimerase/dehydratase family protein [Hydrogenophaga sp. A37]|uniref:NAD-dependent epimerase/dehydratase family protein n=1 Tax=Hydrogenophaga sp. A37 TaxID=1945864 RepID=UPI0009875DA9|nr:NAD-dependent epimerase/dehydratase family protein [Hydrogenophaga sp. A37]OOG84922.1 hypothetical protein B0E41_09875 [Hydrogenophaga sp. A37]
MDAEPLHALASRFRGRRLLVTGGAGAIAANLIRALLAAGCRVDATVRPGGQAWRLTGLGEALTRHTVDVGDADALERVFAQVRPEFVFHLATPRGHDAAARDEMLRVNVLGAQALLGCVRRHAVERLVVAGSSLEYAPAHTALKETDPIAPLTWHGATKAAAAVLYRQAAAEHGVPVSLLRIFHVYGPWESAHRLAPTAIRAALSGDAMPMTAGGIRRDWVYVDDVCEALLLAAAKAAPGDVFNIGSGVETSNETLVACVESVLGRSVRQLVGELPPRATDAEHRFADRSLAQRQLGWAPRHSLKDGLRETAAWHAQHPAAWSDPADKKPEAV